MNNLDHLDVWVRALKTGLIAFLAAWAISGNAMTKDALLAAVAMGGTAVWNYLLQASRR